MRSAGAADPKAKVAIGKGFKVNWKTAGAGEMVAVGHDAKASDASLSEGAAQAGPKEELLTGDEGAAGGGDAAKVTSESTLVTLQGLEKALVAKGPKGAVGSGVHVEAKKVKPGVVAVKENAGPAAEAVGDAVRVAANAMESAVAGEAGKISVSGALPAVTDTPVASGAKSEAVAVGVVKADVVVSAPALEAAVESAAKVDGNVVAGILVAGARPEIMRSPKVAMVVAASLDGVRRADGTGAGAAAPGVKVAAGLRVQDLVVRTYEAPTKGVLEIGISGGTWGWLKVRAEMGQAGEVHAFLRGTTGLAESALKAQTSEMAAYLGVQQVAVAGLHVEATRGGGWTGQMSMGAQGEESQGGQTAGRGDTAGRGEAGARRGGRSGGDEFGLSAVSAVSGMVVPAMLPGGAGSWLSVLA